MAVRLSRVLLALTIASLLISSGAANEPDGRLILRYSWGSGPPGRGGSRLLRVSVTAAISLHAVELRLDAPRALKVTPRGATGRRRSLGDLQKGASATVEFDVVAPTSGGGIASFRVEGTTEDGRSFSEGIGVPVGLPGAVPVVKAGAAEFPASTPADENP